MKIRHLFLAASIICIVALGTGVLGFWQSLFFTKPVKIQHQVSIDQIQAVGSLQVLKVDVNDVVSTKENHWNLLDSEVQLLAVGEAYYTVDLQKIRPADVATVGDTLYIRIPPANLSNVRIDHSRSRVLSTSWLTLSGAHLVDTAYSRAQANFYKTLAANVDLTRDADHHSIKVIEQVLRTITKRPVIAVSNGKLPVSQFESRTHAPAPSKPNWIAITLTGLGLLSFSSLSVIIILSAPKK